MDNNYFFAVSVVVCEGLYTVLRLYLHVQFFYNYYHSGLAPGRMEPDDFIKQELIKFS